MAPRSAVDKALDLVEAIAGADRPPRLSELATEVDLHRATAYRILLDLVERGWVLRVDDRYLLGTAALRVSPSAARNSLVALARPVLEELSSATEMMVNLQVLEADGSRVVDVVRPRRLEMITDLRGERLTADRFAGPLALLAPPADGYALQRGRNEKLVASLSRAVRSSTGAPLCALTVVGPDAEFDASLRTLKASLLAAVSQLEEALR